jgi:hypothetical protein
MGQRLQLQTLLEEILGSRNVYFQPPEDFRMSYPAIVYNRSDALSLKADNSPYLLHKQYMVTSIDQNPDSEVPDKLTSLSMSEFVRHFTVAQLNHDIINLYF